jgi:hypothetical protein
MPSSILNSDDGVISGTSGLKSSGGDDGVLNIQNNGTTAVTVNASGNVGIGTTSPIGKIHSTGGFISTGLTEPTDGGASGSFQIGYNGTTGVLRTFASSPIRFDTAGVERARITSGGDVFIGATSGNAKVAIDSDSLTLPVFRVNSTGSSSHQRCVSAQMPNRAPNDTTSYFFNGGDSSATRAVIYSNGGLANFSGNNVNLSDRREKTNFAPAKNYLETICSIPVQTFNYIDQSEDDPGLTLGVVAQDVQEVAPEFVMESDWSKEKDGSKMRLSIYQTDLQYALMKCIQELKAELDEAKARIAALEAVPGNE